MSILQAIATSLKQLTSLSRKSKRLLSLLLAFQLAFSSIAHAYDEAGDDRGDDAPSVLCIGICDDDSGGAEGTSGSNGDYDDGHDGNGNDDYDSDLDQDGNSYGGVERNGREQGNHDDKSNRNPWPKLERNNLEVRSISRQDSDRGDGVIFLRDDQAEVYYRGQTATDENSRDLTDIYTNRKGIDFVKTADGKGLLPIDGIKGCAPSIDCSELGYKEDWWNYSITPNFDNSDEYSEYEQSVRFAEKQLAIKNAIERAKASSSIRQSPQKMKVLSESEYLHSEAELEFARFRDISAAESLQYGAATLASTIVDIGISVSPLGWGKDAYELITGTNLVTGKKLSDSERIMAGIGVVMPGVAGLAFAGIRIVARNPVTRNAIKGALTQVGNVSDLLGNMKIARFKEGKSLSEVAVIGRDMASVRETGARLKAAGINTRVFEPSTAAESAFKKAVVENGGRHLPYEGIPETTIYRENMDWVQKLKDEQIIVIDIGNPMGLKERSRFYDDEVLNIFGEVNKL